MVYRSECGWERIPRYVLRSTKRRYLLRVDYCKPGLISVVVFAVFGQKVGGNARQIWWGLFVVVVVVVVLGG